MTNPVLRYAEVRVGYRGTPVLTGVDLEIRAGERLILVGPNGAGKSTLIKSMVGLADVLGGVAASPGYVQLQAGQAGVLTPVPLPQPDPNPSYSYAWQWLIFGLMAIGAWIYFVRLEYRNRRGLAPHRDADDPRDAADGTPWDGSDAVARRTGDVLADRYGRR